MSSCPFPHAGPPADVPARIAKLPVLRGFPVPWFVAMVDGEHDFRIMDPLKIRRAVKHKLCWVCGEKMGKFMSFVLGPMCGVTRTNSEPPSHRECAEYSVKHCPFLTRPNMKRREDEVTAQAISAGELIRRNPGCSAVWTVRSYSIFGDGNGGLLFNVGSPEFVSWYAQGRAATRAEVQASIDSGLVFLRDMCEQEDTPEKKAGAFAELLGSVQALQPYLPTE